MKGYLLILYSKVQSVILPIVQIILLNVFTLLLEEILIQKYAIHPEIIDSHCCLITTLHSYRNTYFSL